MSLTKFLHYPVSDLSKQEILEKVTVQAVLDEVAFITVMNANKMYLYDHSPACKVSVDASFIVLPENAINLGMKFLGTPLKEWDLGGVEIAKDLLAQTNLKAFLLGAKQEILDMVKKHPVYARNIVGTHHGYFKNEDLDDIASLIMNSKAEVILLGLGSPKQEILMQTLRKKLNHGVLLGVGGTFDVLAGVKKDAPKWTK